MRKTSIRACFAAAAMLALALAPSVVEEAVYSPLTENDVVVGAAKDAFIRFIQPGVHPYVAAGKEGFEKEATLLGLTNAHIIHSHFDPAAAVANIENAIPRAPRPSSSRA